MQSFFIKHFIRRFYLKFLIALLRLAYFRTGKNVLKFVLAFYKAASFALSHHPTAKARIYIQYIYIYIYLSCSYYVVILLGASRKFGQTVTSAVYYSGLQFDDAECLDFTFELMKCEHFRAAFYISFVL